MPSSIRATVMATLLCAAVATAADRAPQWGALHLAWGRALEAQGRRDQARDKYTEAARLDLSAADRAEVVRRLAVP